MATRVALTENIQRQVYRLTWSGLLNGDVGSSESPARFDSLTVQVKGVLGVGGSINIEGSNDGGTTWHILNDSRGEGNPLTLTTLDTRKVNERPQLIRPNVTAGDGTTSLTAILVLAIGSH